MEPQGALEFTTGNVGTERAGAGSLPAASPSQSRLPCAFIEFSPNEAPGDHRLMVVELKVAGCANPLGAEG